MEYHVGGYSQCLFPCITLDSSTVYNNYQNIQHIRGCWKDVFDKGIVERMFLIRGLLKGCFWRVQILITVHLRYLLCID